MKILFKKDERCLPCLREEEKLASSKFGVLSNPMGSYAVCYMKLCKVQGENGKSDIA
jgi:hypothetical protein